MRVALLTISPLAHDSRILRHAAALTKAGHDVRFIAEAPLPQQAMPFGCDVIGEQRNKWAHRAGLALRQAPATVLPASSHITYWASQKRWNARRALLRFRPDLVIANDWKALPIARAAARALGSKVIYDSHELAAAEFDSSRVWKLLAQTHAATIEGDNIHFADAVVTVSDPLAARLADAYRLEHAPLVVMNCPDTPAVPFRPTGPVIEFLYQGIVAPRRGLEMLIDSLPAWPDHCRLVIRGPDVAGMTRRLMARPAASDRRLRFESSVAPEKTVAAASASDVGLFFMEAGAAQGAVVLPNKLFEYMLAGLAMLVSDLPGVRPFVRGGGLPVAGDDAGVDRRRNTCNEAEGFGPGKNGVIGGRRGLRARNGEIMRPCCIAWTDCLSVFLIVAFP